MNRKITAFCLAASLALAASADGNKNAFLGQQAYDETRRLAGQVDVIQNNLDDINARLTRLERGSSGGDVAALKNRIAALEGQVADLKRQLANQRSEIVGDLSKRISKIQAAEPPPPKPVVKTIGPHQEYVVKSGDTLSLIAEAFGTTVPKIREMNGLKKDNLRVGQKIKVPLK